MLALSSFADVRAAISQAREIDVLAYTLRSREMIGALEAAARRGAHVCVRLEGAPYDDEGALALHNRRVAGELGRCGVDARLARADPARPVGPAVHAKAIVTDGRLFLDDRNWSDADLIVSDDDANAVSAVADAVAGGAPADAADSAVVLEKRDALAREAALLRDAVGGDGVIVESESFSDRNPVYAALDELALRGLRPRLLVCAREVESNQREQKALARLERDGVAVRLDRGTEKCALVGSRAWLGSANASPAFGHPDMLDWGACTTDASIVTAARERAESRWSTAKRAVLKF
jgi:hypothetical protein